MGMHSVLIFLNQDQKEQVTGNHSRKKLHKCRHGYAATNKFFCCQTSKIICQVHIGFQNVFTGRTLSQFLISFPVITLIQMAYVLFLETLNRITEPQNYMDRDSLKKICSKSI